MSGDKTCDGCACAHVCKELDDHDGVTCPPGECWDHSTSWVEDVHDEALAELRAKAAKWDWLENAIYEAGKR